MTSTEITSGTPSPGEIIHVVEHLFRHEAGKMVSILTRIFGVERLKLAEDVVQEALAKALQTWPYYGIPRNPAAWITQVSKNLALDVIRREKVFRNKEIEITRFMEQGGTASNGQDFVFLEEEIKDDSLWMMFMCCHPLVPQEAQVALALKTLCGFQPRRNCESIPYVRGGNCQEADTRQTEDPRGENSLRAPGGGGTDGAYGWRATNALPPFQRRI
jgi:DNA-directed RNA polymerase specialized sigma24 family protein